MWVITTFAVVLTGCVTVNGQYRGTYRRSDSRYPYDWQPRHRPVAYTPRHRGNYYENEHYDNRQYKQRKPGPPAHGSFTYRETSYGSDPLSELDPDTRRAVENSYRRDNDVNNFYSMKRPNTVRQGYKEERKEHNVEQRYREVEDKGERQAPHEESQGSGDDDCSMMKNPRGAMNSAMMREGCRSYKAWGKSMQAPMKWEPTEHQMSWWKSLSMPMSERKAYYRRRHKRQAQAASLRKEYRAMTDQERRAFHNAVRGLKTSRMDGMNMYDIFVGFHQSRMAPGAHFGCAFIPWHRELLFRFERALQTIDPSVTLPYFDSNLDYHLGNDLATQTVTWTDDFAGNGDGRVRTGPFADWSMPFPVNNRRFLFRNLTFAPGARTAPALMSDQALTTILNARRYRDICWNVDSSFETFHGTTHNWIGGVMVNLPTSPSDPMFFLHHGFIDCLFSWMRDNQRSRGINVDFDYPNDTIAMGVGMRRQGDRRRIQRPEDSLHYSLAEMRPFGPIRNIDGLSSFYDDMVQCAPKPVCSRSDTSCGGSGYLFCDESTYRCAPKLRLSARCERFSRYSPCSSGVCCDGVCQESCGIQEPDPPRQPPIERPNQVPDARPNERPPRPVEQDREPPMIETMHGMTDDKQDERPDPDPFQPSEPVNPIDLPEPEHPLREVEPHLVRQESSPNTQPVRPDPEVNRPEELPRPPPRTDVGSESTSSESFSESSAESSSEDEDEDFPRSHTDRNNVFILRAHPGVPTHAPYVIPTLPPIPTHAPYVLPQVPTHPPGFGILPPVPTHPPSVFEDGRQMVKRDQGSRNQYEHRHRKSESKHSVTDERYEHNERLKYDTDFDHRHAYERSRKPYRAHKHSYNAGRSTNTYDLRPSYESSTLYPARLLDAFLDLTGPVRENNDDEIVFEREHRYPDLDRNSI